MHEDVKNLITVSNLNSTKKTVFVVKIKKTWRMRWEMVWKLYIFPFLSGFVDIFFCFFNFPLKMVVQAAHTKKWSFVRSDKLVFVKIEDFSLKQIGVKKKLFDVFIHFTFILL